jgi:perosamine synthetase
VIRIAEPDLDPETETLVVEVLRSGRLAQGPMVERFEAACAAMAGSRHAVAMCNGTVTLEAALEVLDVGPGDEVVTTAFTFAATLNAILRRGAVARFADIGDDHNVDPASMEALVGPRTAVLLPVHLYGLPADLDALEAIADRNGIPIVEDAAQAHGAEVGERRAGGVGIGSFSFYATKNVTTGEGGVVTTSDDVIADRLRILRNQGMRARYQYEVVGHNWRMTELQAAVGIPQLARLPEIVAARQRNAAGLIDRLAEAPVTLPHVPAGRTHVWHQFTVLLPSGADRDRVVAALADADIEVGIYYPGLVWDHPAYRDDPRVVRDDTPRAADTAARCISLPVHQRLGPHDLDRIAAALTAALDG